MSMFLNDFDQWYDEYEAAAPSQQYALVKEAIAQPIPIEYAKEIDLGMILLEVFDLLVNHNQVDEVLALITTLQQQQPDLYQLEFQYFDTFLIKYHLFYNHIDAVSDTLIRFKTNPVQGIDQLIPALDDLQFYDATEPLIDLCQAVYHPVSTSRELIGGSEIEFGTILIIDQFERAYQRLQQGEPIDWQTLDPEVSQYGLETDAAIRAEVEHNLTTEVEGDSDFFQRFKDNRGSALRQLLLGFCRDMATHHQISFIGSRVIWELTLDFLESRELSKKQLAHPDKYFAIAQPALDRYVAQQIGGLLSSRQATGFAILWGIPYLYEFLQSRQIITEQTSQQAIADANALKPLLIKAFSSHLWQYDFVHRWQCPHSIPEVEFAAEAEQFAASIKQSKPLSDQPVERPSWDAMLNQAAKKIAAKTNQQPSKNRPTAEEESPPPIQSTWKPPKPRKSPLQAARHLPDTKPSSKSKQSNKKKKRKGFKN